MTFYARGRKEKNFEAGITKALEAILASPQFLFRVEETPAPAHRDWQQLSPRRLRAGVAAVVLPVGPRAGCGIAEGRRPGPPRACPAR